MVKVGVRELKNRLSHYLDMVKDGEEIMVTDRGKEVAVIMPVSQTELQRRIWNLVREGKARWTGGKPTGAVPPIPGRGKLASDIILEDRE